MQESRPGFDEWRSWPLDRLEAEYSPSRRVSDFSAVIRSYGVRSRRVARCSAKGALPKSQTLRWGEEPNEICEFFAAETPDAPLLVFIHGGYWQEGSRAESLFGAPRAMAAGISYAAVEYDLAPNVTIEAIIDQCRRALCWLIEHAAALGFDPERVHVAGSSAGAHLTAMLLVEGLPGRHGPPLLAGAILLSGVYDLRPLVPTYINRALGMSNDNASMLSPMFRPHGRPIPVVVAWGEAETAECKRQSRAYATVLRQAGFPTTEFEVCDTNHFDIVFKLADTRNRLGRAVLDQILDGSATREMAQ